MIKNECESPGEVHPMALHLLEMWQEIAKKWPVVYRNGYMRCRPCQQAIMRTLDDKGQEYQTSEAEELALRVAHIRQRHETEVSSELEQATDRILGSAASRLLDHISGNSHGGLRH